MSSVIAARRLSLSLMAAVAVAGTVQCSRPPAETVLDCSAAEIRHILRIDAGRRQVEDLALVPARIGEAEETATQYVVRFFDERDDFELILQIDKATGRGYRTLVDHEGLVPHGHGGEDQVVCTPYREGR
jgi:hypothetical protein